MSMKRYDCVSSLPGVMSLVDCSLVVEGDFGRSLVDKSHFVPVSEQVKALALHPQLGMTAGVGVFDFADGKDNGAPVPLARRLGTDIAELSQEIRSAQADVSAKVEQARVDAANEARYDLLVGAN